MVRLPGRRGVFGERVASKQAVRVLAALELPPPDRVEVDDVGERRVLRALLRRAPADALVRALRVRVAPVLVEEELQLLRIGHADVPEQLAADGANRARSA